MPYGTDRSNLIANFSALGKTITVSGLNQISGVTPNDFSSDVIYTVTAGDGSTQNYTVKVTESAIDAKDITVFKFKASKNNSKLSYDEIGRIDETSGTILLTVPRGNGM